MKEVLQSLVDDDLVNTDKCGNQVVFWCLPSEASQKVRTFHNSQLMGLSTCSSRTNAPGIRHVPSLFSTVLSFVFQKKAKLAALQAELAEKEAAIEDQEKKAKELSVGRETSDVNAQLLATVEVKKRRVEELDAELSRFAELDPEHIERIKESMIPVRDAANRWTDNVFSCISWVSDRFGVERSLMYKQFDIPEDMDYLEG